MVEHRKIYWIGMLLLATFLSSCTPCVVREAQTVIAQADSMRAEGGMYNDSAQLVQAYETLGQWQWLYPDAYAHCCYYYGRLLRAQDDPVAAMQVFINATHSRTSDYHILGRVYNNIGDIAHLAGEFQLSYDMFERSANMFLSYNDTILYYFALYRMAYEKAELSNKVDALSILSLIDDNCYGSYLLSLSAMVRACLYMRTEQYDSVIAYVNEMHILGNTHPTGYALKAQALWNTSMKDSALHYAKYVLSMPNVSAQDTYNMLYITSHYNPNMETKDVLDITSQRADIGLYMDNYHSRHAQACEILRQSLQQKFYRKPITMLITIIIIGVFLALGIIIFLMRKKKEIQRETMQEQHKQELLMNQQRILQTKNDLLLEQNITLREQQKRQYINRSQQVQAHCDLLYQSDNVLATIHWNDYRKMCEFINHHFFLLADKLKATKDLSEKEIRLCILVLVNSFSDKQIADILYYSYKTIRSTKRHIALKLGTTSANLRAFLIKKAIE